MQYASRYAHMAFVLAPSGLTTACNGTGESDDDPTTLAGDTSSTEDAFSVGAIFEANGAELTGVAPSVRAQDQSVSTNRQVTIPAAFVNASGHVVLRRDDGSSTGPVVGSAPLFPDWNRNVTVTVRPSVQNGDKLVAVLHADDGDGQFDGVGNDPPLVIWSGTPATQTLVSDSFTVEMQ